MPQPRSLSSLGGARESDCIFTISTKGFRRWGAVSREADPQILEAKDKFIQLGMHCKTIRNSQWEMAAIVRELHEAGIRLLDQASFRCAKELIKEGYDSIEIRTLDKYTCNLRSWLAYPQDKLPDCITISAPVPSYFNPGDEVDVMDAQFVWWHGVVLVVSKCIVTVYWVGFPPVSGSNPQAVNKNRNAIRVHSDDGSSKAGRSKAHDVDWIASNELRQVHPLTYKEVNVVEDEDEEEEEEDEDDDEVEDEDDEDEDDEDESPKKANEESAKSAPRSTGKPGISKLGISQRARRSTGGSAKKEPTSTSKVDDVGDAGIASRQRRGTRRQRHNDDDVEGDEDDDEEEDDEEEEKVEEDVGDSAANAPRLRGHSDIQALRSLGVSSLPKSTAVLEHFYWSQSHWTLEECISTLESLSTNLGDHSEFDDEYKVAVEYLSGRCTAFARLYGNTAFNELFQGAVTALDGYKGRESAQARSVVREHLRKYAFFITPRMWSKYEICLIMCVLLDSSLVYQAINQKTGLPSTETYQNR